MEPCPCGSNLEYAACCQPVIAGERVAETAEQLMRARYAAYVKVETDFLFETTHPEHREGYDHKGTREWAESAEWDGLEIVATKNGLARNAAGEVEFIARYQEDGVKKEHHELALFKKEEERWYFTDGAFVKPKPIISSKVGRNDPCICGSGVKYKKCCGK
jgi:SEC-C motif-containing protein